MTQPIIVFDLDGTLVDTAPDLLASLNHALVEGGISPAEASAFMGFIGHGGRVLIERAFAAQQRALAPAELDRLLSIFLDHYSAGIPGLSRPYPGVIETLNRLKAAGYTLAVCTNKFEGLSVRVLEGVGLGGTFAAICGQDTFAFRKPDPRHLTGTIQRAGGDPERALMVGDSRTDIDTAKAAGIPVVAVDFGYTDLPIHTFEPSRIISRFDELTPELAATLIDHAQGRKQPVADRPKLGEDAA